MLVRSLLLLSFAIFTRSQWAHHLPRHIKPVRYVVQMEAHLFAEPPRFDGSLRVEIEALENTKTIVLNARDLNIDETTIEITNDDHEVVEIENVSEDVQIEQYSIYLREDLIKGEQYNLSIAKFWGKLQLDNVGFYMATYRTNNGEIRRIAVSDFEPTDARKAFPCFDEPHFKASFIIRIIRPSSYRSISNEELHDSIPLNDSRQLDVYRETIPMSSYLVAFAIIDYDHTIKLDRNQVFARPEAIRQGKLDYALWNGVQILKTLEDYLEIPYAFSKIDELAIPPEFFSDEAMENWGLVIESEEHLFCSNKSSSVEDLQRCTSYTAHEFAHQWFGNLVTPAWWKYMWLSESLASFFQYYITSKIFPAWRYMDQFVVQITHEAFDNDDFSWTQPMNQEIEFDGDMPSLKIQYLKGSSVMRMVQHFLTPEVFRRGLYIYLRNNKFGSVEPYQLFDSLQQAVDEAGTESLLGNFELTDIMNTWTNNKGYPLVNVTKNAQIITITQERYDSFGDVDKHPKNWIIPINFAFETNLASEFDQTTANFWLSEKQALFRVPINIADSWIIVNKQQSGYYRVNYDLTNWKRICAYLNSENYKKIHVINRAQLLDDATDLAKSNHLSFEVLMDLSRYLIRETDYVPFVPFYEFLNFVDVKLSASIHYDEFRTYVISILSGIYQKLGFDEKSTDTNLEKLNRAYVLKWLCEYEYADCISRSVKKLKKLRKREENWISPNLETTVLCHAMKSGTEDDYNFLYANFQKSQDSYQRIRLLQGMGCVQEEYLLIRHLHNLFDKNNSLIADHLEKSVRQIIESSKIGYNTTLYFIDQNIDLVRKPLSGTSIGTAFAKFITTEGELDEIISISNAHNAYRIFRLAIDNARDNIDWIVQGKGNKIVEWLQKNSALSRHYSNEI